jgi:hypothetical protein
MAGRDPFVEVPRMLAGLAELRAATAGQAADDRRAFVAAVDGAGRPAGAVPAPVPVPQPA